MPRESKKRMTITERLAIQRGLEEGRLLSSIARDLGVSAPAVSRETKANRTMDYRGRARWNLCARKRGCHARSTCGGCEAVVGALDWIETILGTLEFARLFGTILTDHGVEFCDFEAIERSCISNAQRRRLFYCDPQRSGQKGSCEKSHVELRRVLPKGLSFEALTAFDVTTACTHVNNYPRKSLEGKTPYAIVSQGPFPNVYSKSLGYPSSEQTR